MKRIAVTGAGGYIGTQLVKDLLNEGFEVLAIDRFFFGMETMKDVKNHQQLTILKKDIRDLEVSDLKNVYGVCDLACLSNDPAGEIDPLLTYSINRDGRIRVAKIAKSAGVAKYIISSSCSVYGSAKENSLNEDSPTNPVSVYAKSTLEAEQNNLELSNNDFSVFALRNATVFGISNRMRFDLVVNLMTLTAFQKNLIIIMGGGNQWRPLVHVSDVSQAFINVLKNPIIKTSQNIFNVGLSNFQIKNIAYKVKELLPINVDIEIAPDDPDKRNYNVDFTKAENVLNFKPKIKLEEGILEIYKALNSGLVDTGLKTSTVKWYQNIIQAKELLDSVELNGRILN